MVFPKDVIHIVYLCGFRNMNIVDYLAAMDLSRHQQIDRLLG